MYKYLIILLVLLSNFSCAQEPEKQFQQMSNLEIDQVIQKVSKQNLTVSEKINLLSEKFLGMDYDLTCTGDGPYALLEAWPLVNFQQTNCMAFCEHVLALSISDSWDNFFNNLQQIRYKDGLIGMKTRNHYTMADWLPQNSWILDDVSVKVGGAYTKQVTRTISHNTFFKGKGMTDMSSVLPDRKLTIDYVPLADLSKVKNNTKPGDILALLFANKNNIFSAHMLMIAEKNGQKIIRESSNSKMTTFDTSYDEWMANKQELTDRYIGLAFMRIKEGLNTPGRIIKPGQIPALKQTREE